MCFSAPVSFVASGALAVTGLATLHKVKSKRHLPLAIMPLLFSVQQLIEGFIWLTPFNSPVNLFLVYGFLFFAYLLWPAYFPLAVFLVEDNAQRSHIMKIILLAGGLVSTGLLIAVILKPPVIDVVDCHIGHPYVLDALYGVSYPFYLAAVGLAPMLSSHRIIRLFGFTVFVSGIITVIVNRITFVSLWCFFAAVLSLLLYLFLDKKGKPKGV